MKSKFANEEKQAILERYISKSESPASIIKSVGISKSTFSKWLSDYKREQADAKRKGLTLRNFNLLEAKVKRLEGIIEIIKKAIVLPNAPLQQKLYAAEKLSGEYSVHGVKFVAVVPLIIYGCDSTPCCAVCRRKSCITTYRTVRIVVAYRLGTLGSADFLLGGVNRRQNNTQLF